VKAKVKDMLATVAEDTPFNLPPCDVSREMHSLKLGKACGFDDISNEYHRHIHIKQLRVILSLPGNLEGSKSQTSAETMQETKISV
jgi:hypothetical protein